MYPAGPFRPLLMPTPYPAIPAVLVCAPQGGDPKAGGHSGYSFACFCGKLGVLVPVHQVRPEV